MAKSTFDDCSDSESSEVKLTEEERRKKAYKWYKNNAKPTKMNMCFIVDALEDIGISRQDIDLLPWNLEKTKVSKEEMKALKEKKTPTATPDRSKSERKKDKETEEWRVKEIEEEEEKEYVMPKATPYRSKTEMKKEKARAEKEKEDEKEEEVMPKATPYRSKTEKRKEKELKEEKEKMEKKLKKDKKKKDKKVAEQEQEDSLTSLDNSESSSRSSDAGSKHHGGEVFTRHVNENGEHDIGNRVYADQDEQHRTYEVEEEHKRKREKRRRLKEEATKKSELARQKSKAEEDERDKEYKDKQAKELASREPKFFPKRHERGTSDDNGVKDFTKFESNDGEYAVAQGVYARTSVNEELERKREELRRKKEERRRLREEEKEKSTPKAEEATKSYDDSIDLAFKWYTRMAMPSREEFKRQIEIQRVDITTEDVDLLEWNASGSRVTNIPAMNKRIRTKMMKEATKAPASSQRRRQ
jgi:hypothetical protein